MSKEGITYRDGPSSHHLEGGLLGGLGPAFKRVAIRTERFCHGARVSEAGTVLAWVQLDHVVLEKKSVKEAREFVLTLLSLFMAGSLRRL